MRGFTKRAHRKVSLRFGDEEITYTLEALPVLFMTMLHSVLPVPEASDKSYKTAMYNRRALAMVAESLRGTEEGIPSHPDPGDDLLAWIRYTDDLAEVYRSAGLTTAMINRLGLVVDELDRLTGEELETMGNG